MSTSCDFRNPDALAQRSTDSKAWTDPGCIVRRRTPPRVGLTTSTRRAVVAFARSASAAGPDGAAAYAKHPAYPWLLSLADRVGGHTAMLVLSLLGTWLGRLAPTGRAVLVVQKHLGADSLHRWLEAEGWSVDRRSSRAGYRVLEVRPG